MTIPPTTQRSFLWGCSGVIVIIFFGCYSLKHFEIWLFKCEPLNLKSFYLTSSELVILQLLGKSTVASITIITVYPESWCSIFILPVRNITRTLTTMWILLCYPRKSSHWKHAPGSGIRHLEKHSECLHSQLCYWSHRQLHANPWNSFPPSSPSWNKSITIYYLCLRLGRSEVPAFYWMSQHYQYQSGGDTLYYTMFIEWHQEIISLSRMQMDGRIPW